MDIDYPDVIKFALPEAVNWSNFYATKVPGLLKTMHVPDAVIDKIFQNALLYESRLTGDIIFRSERSVEPRFYNNDAS